MLCRTLRKTPLTNAIFPYHCSRRHVVISPQTSLSSYRCWGMGFLWALLGLKELTNQKVVRRGSRFGLKKPFLSKNGKVHMPETSFMKRTSCHIENKTEFEILLSWCENFAQPSRNGPLDQWCLCAEKTHGLNSVCFFFNQFPFY